MIENSFKHPIIYTIETPVNIDRPIQELQHAFTALPWLEKIYGRTYLSYRSDSKGKLITYPEAWQGVEGVKPRTRDLINVMPNDNLNSQIFFRVDDPINVLNYAPDNRNQMRATLQIIVWFNLDFINKTLDSPLTYRYTEILKSQIQQAITSCQFTPYSSITVLRVYEEAENVFRGYTIDKVKQQELVHPWGGFRFECELTYQEDCPTPELSEGEVDPRTAILAMPNILQWLDVSDPELVVMSGADIIQLRDLTPKANHMNALDLVKPVFNVGIDGKNYAGFINDSAVDGNPIPELKGASQLTLIALVRGGVMDQGQSGTSTAIRNGFVKSADMSYQLLCNGNGNSYSVFNDPGNPTSLHSMFFDGTQATNEDRLTIYKNGVLQAVTYGAGIPVNTSPNANKFSIGKTAESQFFPGDFYESIIFGRKITPEELTVVMSYFRDKYPSLGL